MCKENNFIALNEKYIIQMMVKFRWDSDMYIFWCNVYKTNKKMCQFEN